VGILTGFRGNGPDYELAAKDRILGQGMYPVYDYNAANSKPIFRFRANGRTMELPSEWSVADLGRKDIGRELRIRYFTAKDGSACRVIPEGRQYENQRETGRRIMFWIFAGMGILLCILGGSDGISVLLRARKEDFGDERCRQRNRERLSGECKKDNR